MSKPMRIVKSLMLIAIFLAASMLGYSLIEKWEPLPAFHAAVQTLFSFLHDKGFELSQAGFWFSIAMRFFALGILIYIISSMAGFIIEGRLKTYLKVGQMDTRISGLKDHYIICGAGEISRYIMDEFLEAEIPFIVIEKNPKIPDELAEMGIAVLQGDSADNEILKTAGIDQAAGILAVHTTDSENILAVLSSRQINPDIRIVAGVIDNVNQSKYMFCGADEAIPICELSGRRIATAALHPSVSSFFDTGGTLNERMSAYVVEIELEEGSYLAGQSQKRADIRSKTGAVIIGLIRNGELLVNPGLNKVFRANDRLLVFGTNAHINEFKKLACPGNSGRKSSGRAGLLRRWKRMDENGEGLGKGVIEEEKEAPLPQPGAVPEAPAEVPEEAPEPPVKEPGEGEENPTEEPGTAPESPVSEPEAVKEISAKKTGGVKKTPAKKPYNAGEKVPESKPGDASKKTRPGKPEAKKEKNKTRRAKAGKADEKTMEGRDKAGEKAKKANKKETASKKKSPNPEAEDTADSDAAAESPRKPRTGKRAPKARKEIKKKGILSRLFEKKESKNKTDS